MNRRLSLRAVLIACCLCGTLAAQTTTRGNDEAVRKVILQFEEGVKNRDLTKIEPLMADDLVAIENGHRNDGWADFRDHHLVPEMKEPAPEMKAEIMRVKATSQMGWGYTRNEWNTTRKNGETVTIQLWSTYIVGKRGKEWKIVLLDWSIRSFKPTPPAAAK